MSRQGLGWLVEVTAPSSDGHGQLVRHYHVAIPNRAEAIATVRRRVPDAAGAKVVAVTALSRRAVYDKLRLKRGDIVQAHDVEQKKHIDELLDEGLRQTFPCSDPVAVGSATGTDPPLRAVDEKARR